MPKSNTIGDLDTSNQFVDPETGILLEYNQKALAQLVEQLTTIKKVTASINPSSISGGSTSEQEFEVKGAAEGDTIIVTKPTETTSIGIVNARVPSKDTVAITFINDSGSPINPPEESYVFTIIKA